MIVCLTRDELRTQLEHAHNENKSIGFVPTMGYLHDGHRSLIRNARENCDVVVVSIFVNPTQFGANEDLDRYPRDIENDTAICSSENVDVLFIPDVEEIYPGGSENFMRSAGEVGTRWEGAQRPGHFDGVVSVLAQFFEIIGRCQCFMGRKDAQQLIIVTQFATEFFPKVEIVGCSTIREEDGLALSSRNAYLSDAERIVAPALFQGLDEVASAIEKRLDISEAIESARVAISEAGFVLDYLACLDRAKYVEKDPTEPGQYVVATAGKIGNTRLIDNFFVDIAADGQATVDRGIKRSRLSS